jgi:hypothetical protein
MPVHNSKRISSTAPPVLGSMGADRAAWVWTDLVLCFHRPTVRSRVSSASRPRTCSSRTRLAVGAQLTPCARSRTSLAVMQSNGSYFTNSA